MQPLSSEIHVPSTSQQPEQPEPPELSGVELARIDARRAWVSTYSNEWCRLANGRMDPELAHTEGSALYYVVGHRPAEEIARQHFNACTGADSALQRAEEKYQTLAVEVGLVPPGGPLSPAQLDFAYGVATLCASIGDRFRDSRDGSAGDHIRGMYGPVPF